VVKIKLNQVIAIERGSKTGLENAITAAYHAVQRTNAFFGIVKTYEPREDDGEQFPPESQQVQAKAQTLIENFSEALGKLLDVEATKDWNNCKATATVTVDDTEILVDVPVTYLMWLEKQLVNVRTFITKLPTLPSDKVWHYDENVDLFTTDERISIKTKKIPRNHIKAEATDKHPAQVEVYHEDVPVGEWTTRDLSGALPQRNINEMLERVDKLRQAVITAREAANDLTIERKEVQDSVLGYIFQQS